MGNSGVGVESWQGLDNLRDASGCNEFVDERGGNAWFAFLLAPVFLPNSPSGREFIIHRLSGPVEQIWNEVSVYLAF